MTNALQALLGAKPATEITEQVPMKRLGTEFTIKALTGDDLEKVREQATRPEKQGKRMVSVVNEDEAALLTIVKATVEPNFGDAALLKHFGAVDASDCVQKALLAGEIQALGEAIGQLAGFGNEDEDVEEVKN